MTSRGNSFQWQHSFLSWTQIHSLCIFHIDTQIHPLCSSTKNKFSSSKVTSIQAFGGTYCVPLRVVSLLTSVPLTTGVYMSWLPNSLPLWKGSHLSVSFLTSSPEPLPSPGPILHLRVKRSNQRYGSEWPRRNHLESRAPMDWFE